MSFTFKTGRTAVRLIATAIGTTALLGITSTASAWTVSGAPGSGAISGTQIGNSTITDTTTTRAITCTGSSLNGLAINGTGLAGTSLASLTAMAGLTGCSAPLGLSISMSTTATRFDAVSYDALSQTTSGYLRNLTVSGTAPSGYMNAAGDAVATYSNVTKRFTLIPSGGSMVVIAPTSFLSLFNVGDPVVISAEFAVTPTTIAFTNP